jgi:hypothetical protein
MHCMEHIKWVTPFPYTPLNLSVPVSVQGKVLVMTWLPPTPTTSLMMTKLGQNCKSEIKYGFSVYECVCVD